MSSYQVTQWLQMVSSKLIGIVQLFTFLLPVDIIRCNIVDEQCLIVIFIQNSQTKIF
jgi:hypothetical protein